MIAERDCFFTLGQVPDNCELNVFASAALAFHCRYIPICEVEHIYIYLDGSSRHVKPHGDLDSWAMAVFKVDKHFNHDLLCVSGGLIPLPGSRSHFDGCFHGSFMLNFMPK